MGMLLQQAHARVFPSRLDVFYELGLGGCWDLCAGVLVLEEAGGRVLDPTGAPAPRLPASCLWLYFCLRIESVFSASAERSHLHACGTACAGCSS